MHEEEAGGKTHLEMEADKGEDKALDVLDGVVEDAEAVGVLALLDVEQAADLCREKGDVLARSGDLELLLAHGVGHGPPRVVQPEHAALLDDAPQLAQHAARQEGLFADDVLVLVVAVVCVAQLPRRQHFELEKLVSKPPFVSDAVMVG